MNLNPRASVYVNPVLPTRVLTEKEYKEIVNEFAWQRAREFAEHSEHQDCLGYARAVWDRLTGFESMLDDHNEALR